MPAHKLRFVAYLGSFRAYYRRNARKRGIPWHLTDAEFLGLVKKVCGYCGAHPRRHTPMVAGERRTSRERLNGVDRIDPSKGYEISNCISACKRCNQGKNDMSKLEFFLWVKRIVDKNSL